VTVISPYMRYIFIVNKYEPAQLLIEVLLYKIMPYMLVLVKGLWNQNFVLGHIYFSTYPLLVRCSHVTLSKRLQLFK
jgi:hypothetical protein